MTFSLLFQRENISLIRPELIQLCARTPDFFISFFKKKFFFKNFIYLFLEREGGRVEERDRNINAWLPLKHPQLGTWPKTQACAVTGNQTRDPLVLRPVLNPLSHTSQG